METNHNGDNAIQESAVQESAVKDETPVDVEQFRVHDIKAFAKAVAHGETVRIFDTTLRDGEQAPTNWRDWESILWKLASPLPAPTIWKLCAALPRQLGRRHAKAKMANGSPHPRLLAWHAPTKTTSTKPGKP